MLENLKSFVKMIRPCDSKMYVCPPYVEGKWFAFIPFDHCTVKGIYYIGVFSCILSTPVRLFVHWPIHYGHNAVKLLRSLFPLNAKSVQVILEISLCYNKRVSWSSCCSKMVRIWRRVLIDHRVLFINVRWNNNYIWFLTLLIFQLISSTGSAPDWSAVPQRILETITEEDNPNISVATKGNTLHYHSGNIAWLDFTVCLR